MKFKQSDVVFGWYKTNELFWNFGNEMSTWPMPVQMTLKTKDGKAQITYDYYGTKEDILKSYIANSRTIKSKIESAKEGDIIDCSSKFKSFRDNDKFVLRRLTKNDIAILNNLQMLDDQIKEIRAKIFKKTKALQEDLKGYEVIRADLVKDNPHVRFYT